MQLMVLQTHLTIVTGIQRGSEKITLINFLPDIKTWLRKEGNQKHIPPTSQPDNTAWGACGREAPEGGGPGHTNPTQDNSTVNCKHNSPRHDDKHRGLLKGLTCCTDFQPTATGRKISIPIFYNTKTSVGKWAIRVSETTLLD